MKQINTTKSNNSLFHCLYSALSTTTMQTNINDKFCKETGDGQAKQVGGNNLFKSICKEH